LKLDFDVKSFVRQEHLNDSLLRFPLRSDSNLTLNIQRATAVCVSHKFLDTFKLSTFCNQRRGIGAPECMPADPFLYASTNRNSQRDRDEVKQLARVVPFDLEVLRRRFEDE
jgi:hypothetical protein